MPLCPHPLSLLEQHNFHKKWPCNPTLPTSTEQIYLLASSLDMQATSTTKISFYPTLTTILNSDIIYPSSSISSPAHKTTKHSQTLIKDLPLNCLNMHAMSWSSTFILENQSTNFFDNLNSTNSPMSPLTSHFKSGKHIYHHSNMATWVLAPKNHQSSLKMTTTLDCETIPFSSVKTTLSYQIPSLFLISTSSFEQEVKSELVLMAIYELYRN